MAGYAKIGEQLLVASSDSDVPNGAVREWAVIDFFSTAKMNLPSVHSLER